jgi:para-aminobenzoate synthetase component I
LVSSFPVTDFLEIKQKVLNWLRPFSTFCFLDNHQYHIEPHTFECIAAAGTKRSIETNAGVALAALQEFIDSGPTWLFGHLGYDLKNESEQLVSKHPDRIGFPDLYFFEPEQLVRLTERELIIHAPDPTAVYSSIISTFSATLQSPDQPLEITNRIEKEEYLSIIESLRQRIRRGDCYEINFCQEFFASNANIDPVQIYSKLSEVSPNPFSALYRTKDKWLICASPERFLKCQGQQLISQPMKGTSERVLHDLKEDQHRRDDLFHSNKDRSENVMVVDLVRNDLAKVCEEGTVKVDELYGIYSFPQVHQMVSTVSGMLKPELNFTQIIRACFPMGSMTGAPKKRVMELIEEYERTRRGIFSGALGYISPTGDFDFNVVIRSILYNASSGYLSLPAGSGITFYSDPEQEWNECMLKAAAMKKVLSGTKR